MLTKADFEKQWDDWITKGPKVERFVITQDKWELWQFCEFLKDYKTYLEIGGAWGQTIWFAAHAMNPDRLASVDLCEPHSGTFLATIVDRLNEVFCPSVLYRGDSNNLHSHITEDYEVVFIDGGHSYEQVKRDWENYGPKATKAVVFHDFCSEGPHRLLTEIGVDRVWYSSPEQGMGFAVKFK